MNRMPLPVIVRLESACSAVRRLPIAATALLALACGDGGTKGDAPSSGAPARSTQELPAELALSAEPAGARPIAEIIATLKDGGAVVARGRVGEEGKSTWFTLADDSLKACTEAGDDCPTPWDYCCATAEAKLKGMATVELRAGGALLDRSPLGFAGLDHLKEVVVAGEATKDRSGNVTIVANGIWVKK